MTGFGLYRLLAKANHDCEPSCEAQAFNMADHTMDLTARRPLRAGEELTIMYVDPKLPRSERRRRLASNYFFHCSCGRCERERDSEGCSAAGCAAGEQAAGEGLH